MEASKPPAEEFAAIARVNGIPHAFTHRIPGIDVRHDKAEALRRLDDVHRQVRMSCGLGEMPFITAEQVHGNRVAVVGSSVAANECYAGSDGLITNRHRICLGIYVADCCAVYIVDPVVRAIGLIHSGRKGTELDIVGEAIGLMQTSFGSRLADLIVQLSPCIRPPHYEVDFASDIARAAKARGVGEVHDCGVCTACDVDCYYSYRAEKGRTGRMLALLAMN